MNDEFKRTFVLSESMEIELVCTANRLNVSPEKLLEAILLAYFWENYNLLKEIYKK